MAFPWMDVRRRFDQRRVKRTMTLPRISQSWYLLFSVTFSPVDLGLPVERGRRYTVCFLPSKVVGFPEFTRCAFGGAFFKTLEADGNIFFAATVEQQESEKELLASRVHLPQRDPSGRTWPWTALLTEGEYKRLKGYKRQLLDQGVMEGCSFVSLSQNAGYIRSRVDGLVPTLIRNTTVFRLVLGEAGKEAGMCRLAIPQELLGLQLFPVMLPPNHWQAGLIHFEDLFTARSLPMTAMRGMAGNGM